MSPDPGAAVPGNLESMCFTTLIYYSGRILNFVFLEDIMKFEGR
jgi:hypothetical protein